MAGIINGPAQQSPAQTKAPKFWNIIDTGEDHAEILLYGEVVDQRPVNWWTGEPEPGLYISPEGFLEDLASVKDKKNITIRINSVGGDLYTGLAIYNQLKMLPGNKTVIIDGIAASAASLFAMAGDVIKIPVGGTIMIHEPALSIWGTYSIPDLEGIHKTLQAAREAAASIYVARTGKDKEDILSMMEETSWMVGQDALDHGFATELIQDQPVSMALCKSTGNLLVNGITFNVQGLKFPSNLAPEVKEETPKPQIAAPLKNKIETEGGKVMTPEELKQKYPGLYEEITNNAVNGERARLKAIEEIAPSIGDPQLISDAKYGENPCTAPELAYKALQLQAKQGAAFLQNLDKDYQDSGVNDVSSVPNGGTSKDSGANEIDTIINAYHIGKRGNKNEKA